MEKIIVIGCPGSGKSVFSRALHEIISIPLYHLDLLYWKEDKTTVTKEIFLGKLENILKTKKWIIDGNYGSTMKMRIQECDTVFFLDYPVEVCLDGIRERKGKARPDMPWIEDEESDPEFISFIKNYKKESRPKVINLLRQYSEKNITIFKSRSEADSYLNNLEKKFLHFKK